MSETSGVAKEIERKFLLTTLPPNIQDLSVKDYHCHHGWIPGEVIQERITWVSRNGGECWRTIKTGRGLERIEAQEKISADLHAKLYALTEGKRVQKIRYCVPAADDLMWEIDDFTDRSLVLAEIEIPQASYVLTIPAWLQPYIIKEVTEDPTYLNIKLAR